MISMSEAANLSFCEDKSNSSKTKQIKSFFLIELVDWSPLPHQSTAKTCCFMTLRTVCLCWSDIWRNASSDVFIIVSRVVISAWCWALVSERKMLITMMNHYSKIHSISHRCFWSSVFSLGFSEFIYQTRFVLYEVFGTAGRSRVPCNAAPAASNDSWEIGKRLYRHVKLDEAQMFRCLMMEISSTEMAKQCNKR